MEYFVSGNLNHDGKAYAPGSVVDLTEAQAGQLLEAGIVSTDRVEVEAVATPVAAPEVSSTDAAQPMETGEPSIDGREEGSSTDATDVSPVVEDTRVAVSEDMTRAVLEQIATEEGATQEMIDACANKAELVSLIEAGRNPVEADPSAEL